MASPTGLARCLIELKRTYAARLAWDTYKNLPSDEKPARKLPTTTHELDRWEAIKVAAAFGVVPPTLLLIGGVSVISRLR